MIAYIEESIRPVLMPFGETENEKPGEATLPFMLKDYLDLVDWTGRSIRPSKRGHIPADRPRILGTLQLSDGQWHYLAAEIQKKSILTLNGLDILAQVERRAAKRIAA